MVSRALKYAPLLIAFFILLGILVAAFAGYIQLPMAWKALPRRTIVVTSTVLRVVTLTESYPALLTVTSLAPPLRITTTVTLPVTYTVTRLVTVATPTLIVRSTTSIVNKTVATPRIIYTRARGLVCSCVGSSWRTKLDPCSLECALRLSANVTAPRIALPANIYKALAVLEQWIHSHVDYVPDAKAFGRPIYVSLPVETLHAGIGDYEDIALLGAWILAKEKFTPLLYVVNVTGEAKPIVLLGLRLARKLYVLTWWRPGLLMTAEDACTLILKSTGARNATLRVYRVSPVTFRLEEVLAEECRQLNFTQPPMSWLEKMSLHLITELDSIPLKSRALEYYASAVLAAHGAAPNTSAIFPVKSMYYELPTPWLRLEPAGAVAASLAQLSWRLNNTLSWFAARPCRVLADMPGLNPVKTPGLCVAVSYLPAPLQPPPRLLAESTRFLESMLEAKGLHLSPSLERYVKNIPVELIGKALMQGGTAYAKQGEVLVYVRVLYIASGENPVHVLDEASRSLVSSLPSGLREYYASIYPAGVGCLPVVVIAVAVR